MFRKKILSMALSATLSFGVLSASAVVPAAGNVGDVPFPSRDRAWLQKGDFVNIENLRQMKSGLSKDQVRLLLGNPHFKEGIAGVKEWNYIFNFRTGGANEEHITCQYQVHYAKHHGYAVESMHWDGPACLELINAPEPELKVAEASVERRINLSADALFAFAKHGVDDILPKGREELAAIAGKLKEADNASIKVVGHTDRIGSDAANQLLSQRRAQTVREFLVARGVAASAITAEGRGESEPVKDCEDQARTALIACLAPNRRVEIQVDASAAK
jgi:OmpA-OmpF porin, OOP family